MSVHRRIHAGRREFHGGRRAWPVRLPVASSACARAAVGLARWVLLWFAMSLGVAVASPLVHPQAIELVCSGAGAVKAVVHTDDGVRDTGATHLDCPLCLLTGAPPAAAMPAWPGVVPAVQALRSFSVAHIVAAGDAPPPARGPPTFS